jgi:hypothetical protein
VVSRVGLFARKKEREQEYGEIHGGLQNVYSSSDMRACGSIDG